jgi:hypothetical protein
MLLLTSTMPPLMGCELNPALCLVYFFDFRVLAFTVCSRNDNVVPFRFSVSKLKKEQHRQRSQKHTEEYRVCIPLERLLSSDCYSLKRIRLKVCPHHGHIPHR